ncbi:uncharacterized protein E5676_scaffold1032G00670 [Cucumis melo var. makuwa]|uniref:Uncharacterized protein n=1 Tax=Cucumis melo var. makuwa TaxID=1194695 RepID=A0A5A7SPF8_CUCMM|nr:uncharacterized protein E6C27_scaffold269G002380 [Cucumis melo var. makuwa]TYK17129.1 uncharacterized protein E5676_scaffold1032G00670 [Cucumis melo var. makuwa]
MGQPSPSSVKPSGQKPPLASPLSGVWAHAPLSVNLTAHPLRFYAPSPVQLSYPFGSVDQHHNRSGIEASESSTPSDYGQPYVCGLRINQTYGRAAFEVVLDLLPMIMKRIMENQFSFVSTVRNNDIPRIRVGNFTVGPQEPTGKTNSHTLSAIAQLGMSQSLGLISVDGKNPWILDSGAIDHLIGFSEHFVSYILVAVMRKSG